MNKEGLVKIGEIPFLDVTVNVYYDKLTDTNSPIYGWRHRNPDSFYQGPLFMNTETGEITYPEGATIPEQSEKDRELIPNFIIVGYPELSDELIKKHILTMAHSHLIRNNRNL